MIDIKELKKQTFQDFPDMKGKLAIVTEPMRASVYCGAITDIVKEDCPDIFKTHTFFEDDETSCGEITRNIAAGFTNLFRVPISKFVEGSVPQRDAPVMLISAIDFAQHHSLTELLSESAGVRQGLFKPVNEELRDLYDEWSFHNYLGQALWSERAKPKERHDDIWIYMFNNEKTFGALFASVTMKAKHGDAALPLLEVLRNTFALGLINDTDIALNKSSAIDWVINTPLETENAKSAAAAYAFCRDTFEQHFELHDVKALRNFQDCRPRYLSVSPVEDIKTAFDKLSEDAQGKCYLALYDQALQNLTISHSAKAPRIVNTVASLSMSLDYKRESSLSSFVGRLYDFVVETANTEQYIHGFELALRGLEARDEKDKSDLKAIEEVTAIIENPEAEIAKEKKEITDEIEKTFPGLSSQLEQYVRDAFNDGVRAITTIEHVYNPEAKAKHEDYEKRFSRLKAAWLTEQAQTGMAKLGYVTEEASVQRPNMAAPTKLQ